MEMLSLEQIARRVKYCMLAEQAQTHNSFGEKIGWWHKEIGWENVWWLVAVLQ